MTTQRKKARRDDNGAYPFETAIPTSLQYMSVTRTNLLENVNVHASVSCRRSAFAHFDYVRSALNLDTLLVFPGSGISPRRGGGTDSFTSAAITTPGRRVSAVARFEGVDIVRGTAA